MSTVGSMPVIHLPPNKHLFVGRQVETASMVVRFRSAFRMLPTEADNRWGAGTGSVVFLVMRRPRLRSAAANLRFSDVFQRTCRFPAISFVIILWTKAWIKHGDRRNDPHHYRL